MERDAIVGPDRKAIALVMGRSRSDEEDAANLDFILECVNTSARERERAQQLEAALADLMAPASEVVEYPHACEATSHLAARLKRLERGLNLARAAASALRAGE